MNTGKHIEKITRLIQETLKDVSSTNIYSNYKIKNIGGRNREIDVLVECAINGMSMKIAIECKDYKTPVPVEKIEAFKSKCDRIKGISKKVFVATNGYQADAISAASDFDIELYHLKEMSPEIITSWLPIKMLKPVIKFMPHFEIHVVGNQSDIIDGSENILIYFYENKEVFTLVHFLWNKFIVLKYDELKSYLHFKFIKRLSGEPINKHYLIPFKVSLAGVYILGKKEIKLPVKTIKGTVDAWLEETPANILEARSYSDKNGVINAKTLSVKVGNEEQTDLIIHKNKISFFHTDSNGHVFPLKKLFSYNPKSGKFEN